MHHLDHANTEIARRLAEADLRRRARLARPGAATTRRLPLFAKRRG